MSTRVELLARLGDGTPRSGPVLARALGVSRAAVHKAVCALRDAGVPVETLPGRGYRLARAVTPLDAACIAAHLPPHCATTLTVLERVDSTSSWLLRETGGVDRHGHACVAEAQSAGRGRRGRAWVGGAYRNLMLSFAWRFRGGPGSLAGLSLAIGVALAEALQREGVDGVGLKWPNDLCHGGAKLGGILIDISGEADGPALAVIGVGLNVDLDPAGQSIDQPWTDLARITGRVPDRNRLAAAVIETIAGACARFERDGFAPFLSAWEARDVLRGEAVAVRDGDRVLHGTAGGIDITGALWITDRSGMRSALTSGEVSVRRQG